MNGRPFDKLRANVETIIITDNRKTLISWYFCNLKERET